LIFPETRIELKETAVSGIMLTQLEALKELGV